MKSDMTSEEIFFADAIIESKIYKYNGQQYEDLFISVLEKLHTDFRKIKPQGTKGDQGNDGYCPSLGRYYQCYAPQSPKDSVATAVNKAVDDFNKLLGNWDSHTPLQEYYFVFNDKFHGSFPDIEHAMAELKSTYGLSVCRPFLAKDLKDSFFELSSTDMNQVLNMIIPRSEYLEDIDFNVLGDVIQHLVDSSTPIPIQDSFTVPDFDEKIAFNNIDKAACLLKFGNFQNAEVEKYFNQTGIHKRKTIRDYISNAYQESLGLEIEGADTALGDRVFFRLLEKLMPSVDRITQEASIVLMAYFFEKCDVFEDPS